jgi:hypothetical protein
VRATADGTDDEAGATHLVRSERWNGLRPGDPVRVADLPMRGASWQFRAHVHNLRNGHESVEVVGGRDGDRTVRSFAPGRIFPVGSRRSAKGGGAGAPFPSLAEAPRLPLE